MATKVNANPFIVRDSLELNLESDLKRRVISGFQRQTQNEADLLPVGGTFPFENTHEAEAGR